MSDDSIPRSHADGEARFRALMQATSQIVWVADPEGGFATEQTAWEAFTGQPFGEHRGAGWMDAVHPEDRERTAQAWKRSIRSRAPFETERRVRRGDGKFRWLRARVVPVLDSGGVLREWVGAEMDVDEERRGRAEEALRESEERFRQIAETIREVFYASSVDPFRVLYVSPAYEEVWGKSRDELYRDPHAFLEAIHPADRDGVREALARQLRGESTEKEYRLVREDGSTRWILDRGYPVLDEAGRVRRVVGVAEDITRDKLAERALRESEERLRLAARATNNVIWDWDLESGQVVWNEAMAERFGWTEALGGTDAAWWKEHIHPEDRARVVESIHAAIDRGSTHWSDEYRFERADGGWAEVLDRGYLVRGEDGAPLRLIGAMQDLTERRRMQRQLDASRDRLFSIIENVSDGFYVLDAEWRFTQYNAEAESYFGKSQESVLGRSLWEVFPTARGTIFEERYLAAMETQAPQHFEAQSVVTDRWVEMHAYPAEEGLAVFFRDVTEQKMSEQALRESEERFRNMADNAPVMVWVTEPDGTCTYLNRRWYEFTGQAPGEGLGFGWIRAVHPDDRAEAERAFRESNLRRTPFRIEYRLRRHDGAYRYALDDATPRFGPGGELLGYVGSVVDIHEQEEARRVQEFLSEASRLLTLSLDEVVTLGRLTELAVPALADWCAVDLLEPDGSIRRIAVAHPDPERRALAEEMVRRWPTRSDAPVGVGAVLRTGRPELVPAIPDELLERVAQDEEHLRMLRTLGLHSYLVVPLDSGGERLGALTLVQAESGRRFDASALELAQEVGRRAAAAVQNARLYREAEKARAEAEEANQTKSQFLATMSHELRTPLNAIIGYADLLGMGITGPISERQASQVERIQASSRHLLTLINDILDLAKVESGQLEIARDRVPVCEPLQQAIAVVEHQARKRQLRVKDVTRSAGELVAVGDEDRIRQILVNLLSNAVKFTEPGGQIRVAAEVTDRPDSVVQLPTTASQRWLRLDVEDTGVGIPAERLEHIFEPFVQVDSRLTREHAGTGLGLTISRHLARMMQGDLTVTSEPGQGSRFTLWLRAAPG